MHRQLEDGKTWLRPKQDQSQAQEGGKALSLRAQDIKLPDPGVRIGNCDVKIYLSLGW